MWESMDPFLFIRTATVTVVSSLCCTFAHMRRLGNLMALCNPPQNPLSHLCMVKLPPPQCPAQDVACRQSSTSLNAFSLSLAVPEMGRWAPSCLQFPSSIAPWLSTASLVSPQKKHHLGLRCNRSDVVWKERRICFNLWFVASQPKHTGGLWARPYPGPLPGDGPSTALHLSRESSCSAAPCGFAKLRSGCCPLPWGQHRAGGGLL